jgi:hypothetical protein
MTSKHEPNRKEVILEVAEELGATIFTPAELEQIRRQLLARLGAEGKASAESIAAVLAEAGLAVQRTSEPVAERYEEEFHDLLRFATLEDAEMCLIRLDELLRKFRQEGDRTGETRVREVAQLGHRRAVMISRNAKVDAVKRAEKTEVAQWFRVWLETPEAFFEWLELRKQAPEFRQRFGRQAQVEP